MLSDLTVIMFVCRTCIESVLPPGILAVRKHFRTHYPVHKKIPKPAFQTENNPLPCILALAENKLT